MPTTILLLERDLLDQQIIDVHGHKVVRVNDVDMYWETHAPAEQGPFELTLRIAEVEVGMRGAVRRLLKGLPASKPSTASPAAPKPSVIPWDFVDLIDRDPARRVRLKIEQDRLAKMHPSDLADILEELAPAEREALFSSLDEEVAADTLEEVDLKTQMTLIESLDTERVAGIIEEMDPGAAADLLSELTEERSDAILEEMDEKERQDVEELLDDTLARLRRRPHDLRDRDRPVATATVGDAFTALRNFEGDLDSVTDLFLIDDDWHLEGQVPLSKLLLSAHETPLLDLHESGHSLSCRLRDASPQGGRALRQIQPPLPARARPRPASGAASSMPRMSSPGCAAGTKRREDSLRRRPGPRPLQPVSPLGAPPRRRNCPPELNTLPYRPQNNLLHSLAFRAASGPHAARLNRDLLALGGTRASPDLFWADKTLLLAPSGTLKTMRRAMRIKTVSYMIDNAFGPRRDPGWRRHIACIPEFDLHVTQRDQSLEDYRQRGARDVMKVLLGYEPTIHFPPLAGWSDADRDRGVSFIGLPYDRPRGNPDCGGARGPAHRHLRRRGPMATQARPHHLHPDFPRGRVAGRRLSRRHLALQNQPGLHHPLEPG